MAKILWMDNDRAYLWPHVVRLEAEGYTVVRTYSVSEAERLLKKNGSWDLVIIDPMMNISEEEEKAYPPSETDGGLKAGEVFYRRMKSCIEEIGAKVVVFTMRDDQEIIDDFTELGISMDKIKYKMDASDTALFIAWIEEILNNKGEKGVQLAR